MKKITSPAAHSIRDEVVSFPTCGTFVLLLESGMFDSVAVHGASEFTRPICLDPLVKEPIGNASIHTRPRPQDATSRNTGGRIAQDVN